MATSDSTLLAFACLCQSCGTIFALANSMHAASRKYCTAACARQGRTKPRIARRCQYCRDIFRLPLHAIERGEGLYCSPSCVQKARQHDWAQQFWERITRCDHEPWCPYCCWEWQGAHLPSGYGRCAGTTAHRQSWQLFHNQIMSAALYACHYCHHPSCVNPQHIYPGTPKKNTLDSLQAGRFHLGPDHPGAKLTKQQVQEIRVLRKEGHTFTALGHIYDVSRRTIAMLIRGEHYATVD